MIKRCLKLWGRGLARSVERMCTGQLFEIDTLTSLGLFPDLLSQTWYTKLIAGMCVSLAEQLFTTDVSLSHHVTE